MSQIPTNDDIPSNSQKAREAAEAQPKKPDIIPFEGETSGVKRKGGKFWPWMRKMFLSDRKPSEIALEVLENQVVPGIKDNFRNSLVSGIDGLIYQNIKASSQSTNNSVSYNNIFRSSTSVQKQQTPPKAQNTNDIDKSNGFSNPCFKYRRSVMVNGKEEKGAEEFLQMMKDYDFPTLSVHTMYMMRGQRIDYTWDAYGWNREEIASWDPAKIIVPINNKEWRFMINLPQAHVIS